jgi:hypothetical protein
MTKPLSERVILFEDGKTLPFATVHETWKKIIETWEKGQEFINPKEYSPSDEEIFSGELCSILNFLAHFVCGIENEDGMIHKGTATKVGGVSCSGAGLCFVFSLKEMSLV